MTEHNPLTAELANQIDRMLEAYREYARSGESERPGDVATLGQSFLDSFHRVCTLSASLEPIDPRQVPDGSSDATAAESLAAYRLAGWLSDQADNLDGPVDAVCGTLTGLDPQRLWDRFYRLLLVDTGRAEYRRLALRDDPLACAGMPLRDVSQIGAADLASMDMAGHGMDRYVNVSLTVPTCYGFDGEQMVWHGFAQTVWMQKGGDLSPTSPHKASELMRSQLPDTMNPTDDQWAAVNPVFNMVGIWIGMPTGG